ncbi:MAG: transcriptional regulator [Candidatus Parcubacteria bacterium]|jgi:LCP family protein required for cell wall assembly
MKKLLIIFFAVCIAIALALMLKLSQFYNKINTANKNSGLPVTAIPEDKKVFNLLLMGYGGANHDGPYLTDTMMVAHIDMKKKSVLLISIPRDIWTKVPTKSKQDFHSKINSVYQMALYPKNYPDIDVSSTNEQSAAEFVKGIVGDLLGLRVDNYLAIDFTGFKKAIDILEGVDVHVEKAFDDYEYPVDGKEDDLCGKEPSELPELEKIATESPTLAFPCRYEHLHFDATVTHMDGTTALKYVRSRHSLQDGTDFGRAARQQRLLEAVREKVVSFGFIPKILPLMDELNAYIRTDIDLTLMKKFVGEIGNSKEYKISTVVISNDNYLKNAYSTEGGFILVPKEGIDEWKAVRTWIHNTVEGITPTPTPMDSPTPSPKFKK